MKDRGIQLNDSTNTVENIDLKIVVTRDANGLINQGLVIGATLRQNQAVIIVANPGEFPFNPTIGASVDELILDKDYLRMRHRIREHLLKDGMITKRLELSEGKPLQIDAGYE